MDDNWKAEELRLFAENTGELYPEVRKAVGVLARCKNGLHNGELSIPCEWGCLPPWYELVRKAAWMYQKEIGSVFFPLTVKDRVAFEWASDYMKRIKSGEEGLYD